MLCVSSALRSQSMLPLRASAKTRGLSCNTPMSSVETALARRSALTGCTKYSSAPSEAAAQRAR
jgi:hypothetical protein